MGSARFEETVVYHCSPALVGLKPACLISLAAEQYPGLASMVEGYRAALEGRGIRFELLCRCDRRFLLLVYRPALLERHLARPEVDRLLVRAGYPAGGPLSGRLAHLRRRLTAAGGFPHEIGLFLGYPAEDVRAFQARGGAGCKLCGYWKVYHDVEEARRQFRRFDRCRDSLLARLRAGMTLSQLFGVSGTLAV